MVEKNETIMTEDLIYRTMYYEELETVCEMVLDIFKEHIAPLVPIKGQASFAQYMTSAALERRLKRGHFVILAMVDEDLIVGMIEIRDHKHIASLFIKTDYQKQGIAKKLINEALVYCFRHYPNLKEITVNASVNALGFYEKIGFKAYDEPNNELHATPMVLKLKGKDKIS